MGKRMELKHTVLQDGQSRSLAFTLLAQLCDPKANETEMCATLFTRKWRGKDFNFLDSISILLLMNFSIW